ncbi:MAG: hypothetical protein P8Y69_07795 [Gammaproteobacteria bacterium]
MNKDYRFLVGQRFLVDGETFVVRELTAAEDVTLVEAHHLEALDSSRTFLLTEVIQGLVVEEEIVLFNPNYLAAL